MGHMAVKSCSRWSHGVRRLYEERKYMLPVLLLKEEAKWLASSPGGVYADCGLELASEGSGCVCLDLITAPQTVEKNVS